VAEEVSPARPHTRQAGAITLCWRGWSTVSVDVGWHRVIFDPVGVRNISGLVPAGPVPGQLKVIVCVSHEHSDHLDFACLKLLARSGAEIVGSAQVAQRASARYAMSVRAVRAGDAVMFSGLTVAAGPCDHVADLPVSFALVPVGGPTVLFPHDGDATSELELFVAGLPRPLILLWAGSSASKMASLFASLRPDVLAYPVYTGRHYQEHVQRLLGPDDAVNRSMILPMRLGVAVDLDTGRQ
jgi:hypothetical protein